MKQQTPLQEVSPNDLDQALRLYGATMMGMGLNYQHLVDYSHLKGSMSLWTDESDEKVMVTVARDFGSTRIFFAEGSITRSGLKDMWEESTRSALRHEQMRLGGAR